MGQRMLRFLIGLTLLLLVATMPLRVLAGDEPVVDEGGNRPDLKQQLQELLHPRQPTADEIERRRQEEESRRALQQNALELERMLAEQRASLAEMGPTFAVTWVDGWQSNLGPYLRAACLVGATDKLYMYDVRKDAAAQATGVVDEREFSKAVDLAKSVGHVEWRPQQATYHFGVIAWTMSLDGRRTLLQMGGDYVGALPDHRVGELVKLIDGWCPYAPEIRSRLELPFWEGRQRPPY
jgi:hypothetical protein